SDVGPLDRAGATPGDRAGPITKRRRGTVASHLSNWASVSHDDVIPRTLGLGASRRGYRSSTLTLLGKWASVRQRLMVGPGVAVECLHGQRNQPLPGRSVGGFDHARVRAGRRG